MTPNFDALRRHTGYFWIILGFRCMMASALILLGGTLVLQPFTSEQSPPVVVFILFGFGFVGVGLTLAGGYTAWDLVAREFAMNPGRYLDSVSGARFHEMAIIFWKDVLIPGHRKKLRP